MYIYVYMYVCMYIVSQVVIGIKNLPANAGEEGDTRDMGSVSGLGKSRQPTPVFLPVKSDRQKSLVG